MQIKLASILNEITSRSSYRNEQAIEDVFEKVPELSSIGNVEQYADYLESIFPNTKVKKILYHGGSKEPREIFVKTFIGNNHKFLAAGEGFYFTEDPKYSNLFGPNITLAIIDMQKPVQFSSDSEDYDSYEDLKKAAQELPSKGDGVIDSRENLYYAKDDSSNKLIKSNSPDYIVFEPDQIHVLGSKNDVESFRKFIKTQS